MVKEQWVEGGIGTKPPMEKHGKRMQKDAEYQK